MKLIKEDDKLFHFQTPDGEFKVVKKGLSKAAVDKINQIKSAGSPQKFADGGEAHPLDPDKAKPFAQSFSPTSSDQAMTQAVQHPIDSLSKVLHFKNGGEVPHYFDGTPPGGVPFPDNSAPTQTIAQNNTQLDRGISIGDPDADAINPGQPDVAPERTPASLPPDAIVPPPVDVSGATDLSKGYQDPALANNPANPSVAPDGSFAAAPPLATPGQPAAPSGASGTDGTPTPPTNPYDLAAIGKSQVDLLNANGKITAETLNKEAALNAQYQTDQKTAYDTFQKNLGDLNAEHDQLFKDVQNGKIDPNRFINSQGAGNKISSAIGIILSGLGAGASGNNLALGVLKDQINKDIESQKDNLGNKQNLLTQNLHRFGNLYAAETATKTQLGAMYAGQIQQLAMKSGSQMALNNSMMAGNTVKAALAPAIQQQAQFQAVQQIMKDPGVAPESKIRFGVPAAQQKDAFEALDKAKLVAQSSNDILATFNQLKTDNTIAERALHGGSEPGSATTFDNLIFPIVHDKEGKINQVEADKAMSFKPMPGDSPYKLEQKENGLRLWLQNKPQSMLQAFNVPFPKVILSSAPKFSKRPESQAAASPGQSMTQLQQRAGQDL